MRHRITTKNLSLTRSSVKNDAKFERMIQHSLYKSERIRRRQVKVILVHFEFVFFVYSVDTESVV